jgi:hypothetical protein
MGLVLDGVQFCPEFGSLLRFLQGVVYFHEVFVRIHAPTCFWIHLGNQDDALRSSGVADSEQRKAFSRNELSDLPAESSQFELRISRSVPWISSLRSNVIRCLEASIEAVGGFGLPFKLTLAVGESHP